jgi:chemotaxis protein histidine kinase CheA
MSADWDDELAELRALYLREAGGRLDELERALELLDRDGGDRRALHDLRHGFHAFAGSGATYGMPAVSALGREGERRCGAVGSGPAVAADLRCWRDAVALLRREIASATDGAVPAAPDGKEDPAAPAPPATTVLVIEEDATAARPSCGSSSRKASPCARRRAFPRRNRGWPRRPCPKR